MINDPATHGVNRRRRTLTSLLGLSAVVASTDLRTSTETPHHIQQGKGCAHIGSSPTGTGRAADDTGLRSWGRIQTALFFDRFAWHSEAEHGTFVEVYGYDVIAWAGYDDLAAAREGAMTSWLARRATTSSGAAAGAAKRVHAMRTGGSRRQLLF